MSTDWNDKSGFAPGHEHPQWKGVSFTEAYNELKNTATGTALRSILCVGYDAAHASQAVHWACVSVGMLPQRQSSAAFDSAAEVVT